MIRFERHVYQAGSRVGALIEGSWRKVQPNATSRRAIAPIRTSGLDSQPRRTGSGTCTAASGRSFVSAIGLRDPPRPTRLTPVSGERGTGQGYALTLGPCLGETVEVLDHFYQECRRHHELHSFPTRRSSD